MGMKMSYSLSVVFFKTDAGNEPARNWLKELSREEKKIIGTDIKTVQYGWPIGMPLVKPLRDGLWEIRSELGDRIARTFFIVHNRQIVLLHGIIKKGQKIPKPDLELARKRLSKFVREAR